MSSQNLNSLNGNQAAKKAAATGAGLAGSVAAATATLPKATATAPVAVIPVSTRLGTGTTPPATAIIADRSALTNLGK